MKLYLQDADNADAARALQVLSGLTDSQQSLLQMIASDKGDAEVEISDDNWKAFGELRVKAARKAKDYQAVSELTGGR